MRAVNNVLRLLRVKPTRYGHIYPGGVRPILMSCPEALKRDPATGRLVPRDTCMEAFMPEFNPELRRRIESDLRHYPEYFGGKGAGG
jgi:hypothetical protein